MTTILFSITTFIVVGFIISLIAYDRYFKYKIELDKIETSEMGDLVRFGEHEWYVIDKTSDSCTLLCNDVISMPYNDKSCDVTWETCSLRAYLNDSFYNEFSTKEKEAIIKKECVNKGNGKAGISDGNNTEDYVYILSYDEVETLDKNILGYGVSSWLRTPGERADEVLYIGYYSCSYPVNQKKPARPVITIDLSK